ncbi:XdhC family protein [Pseudescherichia sp.]|uniref:XdhC family protein n=1 Tax=Pseudescherichia sp. TaxID=2055881 RepID=UPI0028ABE04D|nr:XdhC family protein [Pseudescherichia sp.]
MLPQPVHIATEHDPAVTPQRAFLTDDSVGVLRFATQALASGMAAALIVLTEIRGGAARPLGAQMAVREDGLYCGFVSGGCVEAAAAWEALEAIKSGADRTVIYGEGSPWFDIVLPCGGGITLSIHPLRSARPLLAVLATLERRHSTALRYSPHAQTLHMGASDEETGWREDEFVIHYRPATRVIIFGRSVEADMAAKLADAAGYDVHIDDGSRLRTLSGLIDAHTAVIFLWHDLDRELPLLSAALTAAPFYIGALGSRRTHEKRVRALTERGFQSDQIARIKAPIGIFPQARDASSLALSVLADVAAARGRGTA